MHNQVFPRIPVFESLLDSICFSPEAGDDFVEIPLNIAPGEHSEGHTELFIYRLAHSRQCGTTIESFRSKLTEVLTSLGHVASDDICDALLALFIFLPKELGANSIDRLNLLLSTIAPADIVEYYISFLKMPEEIRCTIGEFSLGPLDIQKLSYRCMRAGSDFFGRYAARFSKQPFTISRLGKTNVIVSHQYYEVTRQPHDRDTDCYLMLDHYYFVVATKQMEGFANDFHQPLKVPIALGTSTFSLDRLLESSSVEKIVIFANMNNSSVGWVSPLRMFKAAEIGPFHIEIPYLIRYIEESFGRPGDSPIDRVIEKFSQFLHASRRLQAHYLDSDAFLYHVIALDLLLGDQARATASVASRAALLTHKGRGISFPQALKQCTRIYDARSRYVHAGEAPDPNLMAVVEEISREVLVSLFRLKASGFGADQEFHASWVKRVDVLVAKIAAGDECEDHEWKRVGAATDNEINYGVIRNAMIHEIDEYRRQRGKGGTA